MIYEKPGSAGRSLPRRANRELVIALVLFSCAAAMAIEFGIGAYCGSEPGRQSKWPCMPRHAGQVNDHAAQTQTAVAGTDDGSGSAPGLGASGVMPPVASTTSQTGSTMQGFATPTVIAPTPTFEIITLPTPTELPMRLIPTAAALPTRAVPTSSPTLQVVTPPPLSPAAPSETATPGGTVTEDPDAETTTPTATETSSAATAYPGPGG